MKRLAQIGITFMKSNKMLTLSAFLSIFVACFLSISMFQVSSNVEQSIERGMEAQKGAFDLQITKNEGKFKRWKMFGRFLMDIMLQI
ncbi:MAG: hypothetical protein BHW06_05920 [Clostridium sp. 44_14]|nr:MAG: hypothetical protein BHW06_05920 [Clostridium sp. 44_14]